MLHNYVMIRAGGAAGVRAGANTNQCHLLTSSFEGVYCCWNLVYARASFQRIQKCRHVGPEASHVGPEVHSKLVGPDQKVAFYRDRIATIA